MLIPTSNSSNPCDAIDALSASRPWGSDSYHTFQFACMGIMAFLTLGSIPLLYWLKDEPRFYKIRPFGLSVVYNIALCQYTIATLLPEAQVGDYPCELELFFHTLGPTILCSMLFGRAFMLVVETQYQKKLGEEGAKINANGTVTSEDSESVTTGKHRLGFRHALVSMIKLSNGFMNIDDLSLEQLTNIQRNYIKLFAANAMPPFVVLAVGIAALPIYRSGCVNCYIFVEFVIVVMLTPFFTLAMVVRCMLMAWKLKTDEQGVLSELKMIMFYGIPFSFVAYFVMFIPDPNNHYFNREFNPQFFSAFLLNIVGWIAMSFTQIVSALSFRRERARMLKKKTNSFEMSTHDFTTAFLNDPQLKSDFYKFAAARYCNESLNFIEDIKHYRIECESGQSDKWKVFKARKLINTYIREGSNQEVNISSSLRAKVLARRLETLTSEELNTLFNASSDAILDMLYNGTWTDFQNARSKKARHDAKKGVVTIEQQAAEELAVASPAQ